MGLRLMGLGMWKYKFMGLLEPTFGGLCVLWKFV